MKNIFLILLIVAIFFLGPNKIQAADNGNGVDVIYFNNVHSFGVRGIWYTSFDPTSTSYVYNQSGGTALTSGLIDVKNIVDKKTLFVFISTLNSTSITVRVECKYKGSSVWAEVYSQTFTAATTIAESWPLLEYSGDLRVGLIVVGDASGDVVDITGEFVAQKK